MLPTRLIFAASSLVAASCSILVFPPGAAVTSPAFAQTAAGGDEGQEPKQVALTQKLIDSLLAAQPAIATLQAKAQAGNADKPDPKLTAQIEAITKKNGFARLSDYEAAADSVAIVLAGMDPDTKTYVGSAAIIKKQIAQVQADKTLPPKDKAETLKEMKEALATAGDVKPAPGNVELVAKNYDKLSEGFQQGGE